MAELTLADPATIDERLSDLAERIWQVKGVVGAVRDAVSEEDACSDTANALSLAYGLLTTIGDEVADAHKPDYTPDEQGLRVMQKIEALPPEARAEFVGQMNKLHEQSARAAHDMEAKP